MNKTIGILAHVDAGKTTFSEQILYHTNSIRKRGRVDHQDTFLDNHDIERQRGITVFAEQAMFSYRDSHYYLIDTPGHVDFSPEMERAIQVMDYAVIIMSAVEGIEGHTETVWELLRKHQVPTFFFINKIDRVGADVSAVIKDIRLNLTEDVYNLTDSLSNGEMSEDLIEFIAERNEALFERYMEKGYDKELWLNAMKGMINENQFFPCMCGSALQDIGVDSFLEKIDLLTSTFYENESPFAGQVYKIRHDENGTRVTFIKALQGTLHVREEIEYGDGDKSITEKVTQIRLYSGNKFQSVRQVEAGQLFAVTGLSNTEVGEGIGSIREKIHYEMIPTLKSKVIFETGVNIKEAIRYFNILDAEDPSLNVIWEESLQEIHIHVMGIIQLEVLEQIVFDRFQLKVTFDKPEILYKETIETTVNGYGHFEPLGHYAEVHMRLEPAESNSGITFENACHADDLSVGNQNLIQHHLFEREHNGLLTGSPLTDVKVTLLTGRAHNKHTSGGDFREATFRALRQGLEKAKNIVLEPVYQYKIKIDIEQMGRVISDIQARHGIFDPPKTEGDKAFLSGIAPVATFMDYPAQLSALTHGKGAISLVFSGYERCHNEKEVIERIGYDKNADPKYTSSSIFCAKGQGYTVRWEEAEQEMHAL
ncbi:TetM/TetW/TetO/TetS family tetracycline resistance ribosomal protection protein [Bacillus sp. FJAT-49732]|uniref:TetM/TetW/TetO/TetS family tetracycline resistance ribosomal protection protein n=1 Tax=Lederbergia citrisecunda TaxID=2833583 RepID=A0A942YL30_9BACI|nr:TetM/TetW/TetO/TetS family tetracycline resistance ribosomal protection protein [Lederbergia citrisecunda]MBS4201033.1 TetM/TetW/TetO/TetS family tetracycline resistance ribosomal protection protein [Lederbergia citrisecunda]